MAAAVCEAAIEARLLQRTLHIAYDKNTVLVTAGRDNRTLRLSKFSNSAEVAKNKSLDFTDEKWGRLRSSNKGDYGPGQTRHVSSKYGLTVTCALLSDPKLIVTLCDHVRCGSGYST